MAEEVEEDKVLDSAGIVAVDAVDKTTDNNGPPKISLVELMELISRQSFEMEDTIGTTLTPAPQSSPAAISASIISNAKNPLIVIAPKSTATLLP